MSKTITRDQFEFMLACQVTKWGARLADCEAHGAPEPIPVQVEQRRIFPDEEEHTMIEIFYE
jgi:hypothetical protein